MLFLLFGILSFSEAGDIFLIITPGAKAVSMGSAFTALTDDATCIYYNPAGLPFVDKVTISSMNLAVPAGLGRVAFKGLLSEGKEMHIDVPIEMEPPWLPGLYEGMRYMFYGAVIPITHKDAMGIGYTYISTGITEGRDAQGNLIGKWESYDYAISLAYGRKIWKGFSVGVSLKYIYSFLCPSWIVKEVMPGVEGGGYAKNVALDMGILYKTPLPGLSLGVSYLNLGDSMSYSGNAKDPLPATMRGGIAFTPTDIIDSLVKLTHILPINLSDYIKYTCTWDEVKDMVGKTHERWYCKGTEFTLLNLISFRKGYFEDINGSRVGKTWGYGLNLGMLQLEVATDADIYDFYTDNWRVQVNMVACDTSDFYRIRQNPKLNTGATILSSLVIPGGGQFYNGERYKGLLLSSLAFYFAEWDYRENKNLPKIGLGFTYALSLADAIWNLLHKKN